MIILNENTIEARILASKIAKPGELIVPNEMPKEITVSPTMAKKKRSYPEITGHPVLDLKNVIIVNSTTRNIWDGQGIHFFDEDH